jgi:hypothetical protein
MINASATPPSAPTAAPKDLRFKPTPAISVSPAGKGPNLPGMGAAPASPAATASSTAPKKPRNRMMIGLLALLVIVIGVAAGGYLVMNNQELRQQASNPIPDSPDPDGTCGGVTNDGERCAPTKMTSGLVCVNACKCGSTEGQCGNKGAGETCYTGSQCTSGTCNGGQAGTNARTGTCAAPPGASTTPTGCFAGWTETQPQCNIAQGTVRETQNGIGCFQCREKQGIAGGERCGAQQGCICQSGSEIGQSKSQGQECAGSAAGCWIIDVPPPTVAGNPQCIYQDPCTAPAGSRFVSQSTCNQALQSGNIPGASPGTGGRPSCSGVGIPFSKLWRGDNTETCVSTDGVTLNYQCKSGYSPIISNDADAKYLCLSTTYSAAKRSCIVNQFRAEQLYNTSYQACTSGATNRWSDDRCAAGDSACTSLSAIGGPCGSNADCSSGICNTTLRPGPGGDVGVCEGGSVGPCCVYENNKLVYKPLCQAKDRVSIPTGNSSGNMACNNTSAPVPPGPVLNRCPNDNTKTPAKWITFTCDKCVITTEGGVTAPRCYDNPKESATYPGPLDQTKCGQIDAIDSAGNYCGYYTTDYTCGKPECLPTTSPPPSTPVSPPPSTPPQQVSCASLTAVDATTLQPLGRQPNVGETVRFRCAATAGLTPNYFFLTYRTNRNAPLDLIYQGTSDLSFPILVTDYFHLQCNPCVGTTCSSAASVNQNCNVEIASSSPPPSPTPSPGPQCLSIALNNISNPSAAATTDPKIGETINFTCGEVAGAARYIFRVRRPDGTITALASTGRNSANMTVDASGMYAAQCQICTGADEASCHAFEQLPQTVAEENKDALIKQGIN